MMKPLISVIIPAYNAEKTIVECLTAVCGQSYQELEIIVINDGSTDCTSTILADFQTNDSRIKIIDQNNGGVSSARNAGLMIASGDYIAFVDSDDIPDREMIEVLFHGLVSSNSDISICGHWVTFVGQRNKQYGSLKRYQRVLSGNEALQLLIYDKEIKSYPWDKLYKRALFQGILFPVGRIYEDYATMYKVFMRAQGVYQTSQPLYQYVHIANSLSRNFSPRGEYHFFLSVKERFFFMQNHPWLISDMKRFTAETVSLTFTVLKRFIRMDRSIVMVNEIKEIKTFFCSFAGFDRGHLNFVRYIKIVLMMRFLSHYSAFLRIVKNISTYLYTKVKLSG